MYQNLSPLYPQQFLLPIKVFYQNGDVKRISLQNLPSYVDLLNILLSHIENKENYDFEKTKLYYKDNQNDWILCSTDLEISDSLKFMTDLPSILLAPKKNDLWVTIQKVIIFLSYVFIYTAEEFFSRVYYKEFLDVGFLIFKPVYQLIKPESMYWMRFLLFGAQTLLILFLIFFSFVRVFYFNRLKFGYQISFMYFLRIGSMLLFVLPNHPELIWHFPGIPETTNDYFFSGHVALSILVGNEFYKLGYPFLWRLFAIYFNIFQTFIFMVTRSHYSADVITGVFCGMMLVYSSQEEKEEIKYATE